MKWLDALFERHKFVRRAALAWACWLITVVVLRVTDPAVFVQVNAAGATIVTAVVGILTAVIGLYQWCRSKDDDQLE